MEDTAITASYNARNMACTQCGKPVTYYDQSAGYFCCTHCYTFFQLTDQGYKKVLRYFAREEQVNPSLSLGAMGELEDISYVVTGFIRKKEMEGGIAICWNEYLLYNKDQGYVTLVDFSGHWMLVKPVSEAPDVVKLTSKLYIATYEEQKYSIYHSYSFKIIAAAGAFDENILDNERLHTWEYIAPPLMMVQEQGKGGAKWYQGRYILARDIEAGFDLRRRSLPAPSGVGVIQPSPYAPHKKGLTIVALILFVGVIATSIAFTVVRPASNALSGAYRLLPDSAASGHLKPIVTESFVLPGKGAIEVGLQVSLSDEWLETSISLINEHNGSTYDFSRTLAYYSGVDDGERWTEGSESGSALLSGIPAGTYHLNIYPYAEKFMDRSLVVTVENNPVLLSNTLLLLLVILSVPVINHFLDRNFEKRRIGDG